MNEDHLMFASLSNNLCRYSMIMESRLKLEDCNHILVAISIFSTITIVKTRLVSKVINHKVKKIAFRIQAKLLFRSALLFFKIFINYLFKSRHLLDYHQY